MYALFAQRKLTLNAEIGTRQTQQAQLSDTKMGIATHTLSLQSAISNLQATQSHQLADQYKLLGAATDSGEREDIQNAIKDIEYNFEAAISEMQAEIQEKSISENALDMQIKRLDTHITALKKDLEKTQEAEKDAIEKDTPQYNGLA